MKTNKPTTGKRVVLAIGGSIVFPNEIDVVFLKKFVAYIKKQVKKGCRFVFVVGGGRVCRKYQKAGGEIVKLKAIEKDMIGIAVTRMNAYFIKTLFGSIAETDVFDSRHKFNGFKKKPIIIACGWEPGGSTDLDAVLVTVDFGLKETIIMGNTPYVYTADPQIDKNAKPLTNLTWKEYFNLIPKKWTPGMHSPVDPVASKIARDSKLKVIVTDGDFSNLTKILEGKKYRGTIISDN
ncbi:MAG: UMP kinase [bacterium]